jgi:hypothetical protein
VVRDGSSSFALRNSSSAGAGQALSRLEASLRNKVDLLKSNRHGKNTPISCIPILQDHPPWLQVWKQPCYLRHIKHIRVLPSLRMPQHAPCLPPFKKTCEHRLNRIKPGCSVSKAARLSPAETLDFPSSPRDEFGFIMESKSSRSPRAQSRNAASHRNTRINISWTKCSRILFLNFIKLRLLHIITPMTGASARDPLLLNRAACTAGGSAEDLGADCLLVAWQSQRSMMIALGEAGRNGYNCPFRQ